MSLGKILVVLYRGLSRRRWLLYLMLSMMTIVMVIAATGIKFTEDPMQLFPAKGEGASTAQTFSRLKAKDKIIVLITAKSVDSTLSSEVLADAADAFRRESDTLFKGGLITNSGGGNSYNQSEVLDFIYNNLPLYLEEIDYKNIEESISTQKISERLESSMAMLLSPAGAVAFDMISRDPLFIGSHLVAKLDSLRMGVKMNLYRDYVYSGDWKSLFFVLSPGFTTSKAKSDDRIVKILESAEEKVENEFGNIDVMISGAPLAGVYNARVIKRDTVFTSLIALVMISLLFWFSFRDKRTLVILIVPALFGSLFAISVMSLRGAEVSAIAIGAGATVMGIALSYSIHVISHLRHVKSIEQLIEELAYPLTVGGFTTIGAFIGLLFTNSALLRDFGLFSSLTLTGTTIFSLIFLPHFLKVNSNRSDSKVYSAILKLTSFQYENIKWLKWLIASLFVAGLILAPGVKFDSDFANLGYEPDKFREAQSKFTTEFGAGDSRVFLISSSSDIKTATDIYFRDNKYLDSIVKERPGLKSASVSWLIPPMDEQRVRLENWNNFWSKEKVDKLKSDLISQGLVTGYSNEAFNKFFSIIDKEYTEVDFSLNFNSLPSFIREWTEENNGVYTLITQFYSQSEDREELYRLIGENTDLGIMDRAHFSSVWAISIKEDFNLILVISSLLVFFTLLISYGRIELATMAFLPMAVSWIIILGLMNILGIEFNIFNILLATFIFGIGDDFSIFVLDGLSSEYQGRGEALASHKSAIFFSTFTVLAGVGSMAFATHPALKSIALVSIIGISAVWLVAYTIQPVVYRYFITNPASRGLHPYTFFGVAQMILTFSAFFLGCVLTAALIPVLMILPVKHSFRQLILRKIIKSIVFLPVMLSPTVRIFRENSFKENFSKPAVIIANHQSFIDILMLLSLNPKIIMMTNKWVWNSPVFGHIVRFAGFVYYKDGVENHIESVRPKIKDGYSLLIFPEGTRSADMEIHRFHKGAFKFAEELSLDILPVLVYGNGNLVSKSQPFYVKRGVIGYRILSRITPEDNRYGSDYRERSKNVARMMREEYANLRMQHDIPSNLYFYQKVMSGYIYKGPVTEWYLRVKMRMEKYYEPFHNMIPLDATITDIGCGYGPLCMMLGSLSSKREITGIDYDKEKIDIAKSSWLSGRNINFLHADVLTCDLPESDVFVMNDVLHYLMPEEQVSLIKRAILSLKPNGFIILRDGDSEKVSTHKITRLSEWFSIKLLGFNKASHDPCFINGSEIRELAERMNCDLSEKNNDKVTSNTIFIMKPKQS